MLSNDAIRKIELKTNGEDKKSKDKKTIRFKIPKKEIKINPCGYNPKNYPYRNGIGVTLYLNTSTRPDLSYAVNNLGRRQCNYSFADWKSLQRLLRYIRDTADQGITYTYTTPNSKRILKYSLMSH